MQPGHEQLGRPALERAFESGGEVGAVFQRLDWSRTPLGPVAHWPQSLCDAVSLMLGCGAPMILCWGLEDLVHLYNDAALPVVGQRHPGALGRPLREVWPELLGSVVPFGEVVLRTGRPVTLERGKLLLNRGGRLEAGYFTFSFSPVRNDRGDIEGVLNTFIEITGRVLSERRLRTLRELAVRTVEARCAEDVCTAAVAAMALNRSDLPFALVYLGDAEGKSASRVGALGLVPREDVAPREIALGGDGTSPWPLARVARTNAPEVVTDLLKRYGALVETGRAAPKDALVLPAMRAGEATARAFLVAGLNPHRPLDDAYTSYLQLLAGSIGAAIAKVRADADTRARAEQLAELDRAKTNFISNMSHEFRTPITLVLGPVEDMLADPLEGLTIAQREQLLGVRRAALCLLHSVNEGLSRGADDYVVKPFSSRELLARVDTHLELARSRREMGEQKLKDEFVMTASHELWTPLTALKLDLQLARRRLEKAGLPQAALLTRVDGALARMETLIGDLLTASGIERGDLPLRTEPCDLVEVCRLAAEQQSGATQREVTLALPERAVEAVVDPNGIEHAVSSLLSNALKFSPPNRKVTLTLRAVDAEAVVSVRDEGPGIPAEELPRLFERFHRVPGIAVQSGSMVGLGLGLYICKAIVERHRGRVLVESDVGKGSTFSIVLPLRGLDPHRPS